MADPARTYSLEEVMAHLDEIRERQRWYRPGMWMVWRVKHKARDAQLAVKWAFQRVVRGWDDRAVWSLDHRLSEQLGEQLTVMADIAHGYPGRGLYPADHSGESFDRWVADLRKAAAAFTAYAACDYVMESGEAWEKAYADVQEALHWMAENFAHLWD